MASKVMQLGQINSFNLTKIDYGWSKRDLGALVNLKDSCYYSCSIEGRINVDWTTCNKLLFILPKQEIWMELGVCWQGYHNWNTPKLETGTWFTDGTFYQKHRQLIICCNLKFKSSNAVLAKVFSSLSESILLLRSWCAF